MRVFDYCLMTNHMHLLLAPSTPSGVGRLMKRLAGRQTRFRNSLENRRGTLWEGRYKSSVVDADEYLMACVRYIELNPVRAGMIAGPIKYKWTSCQERLGVVETGRCLLDELPFDCHGYKKFLGCPIPSGEWEFIRNSVKINHITGSDVFCERIESALGRRLQHRKPGRPKKRLEIKSVPV